LVYDLIAKIWPESDSVYDLTAIDKKYVSPNPPGTEPASRRASGLAATSGTVWVNTRSGKYWKPGSRYYGVTKQGEFMTEKEAIQKGYRPANGTGE
jgi:hypothetical protein